MLLLKRLIMQELRLRQTLTQRLTPQQIQLIKLLQVPAADIKGRIEQELSANPVLEQTDEEPLPQEEASPGEEVKLEDYLGEEPYKPWYRQRDGRGQDWQDRREAAIPARHSLQEHLLEQLYFLQLSERQQRIGEHLLGSLESDGYIRRDLEAIVNDLAFTQYIETDVQEVTAVLQRIQELDPPGIGARNLQECLLIQLQRKGPNAVQQLAIQILTQGFEALSKKHYDRLAKKLRIGDGDLQLLREAIALIGKLNPKPGGRDEASAQSQPLYPDFVVTKQDGQLHVALSAYHTPKLGISKRYTTMLADYQQLYKKDQQLKEAATFVKQKLAAAQGFITAIKQRQQTLLHTMQAIVKLQHDFFIEEEENKLKPMILKDVAREVGLDVSTISRVVTNKSVQTTLAVYPLKRFFTEAISTSSGEEVSSQAVKQAIATLIGEEDKQKPYADDKLVQMLRARGYQIARRTVAKYREQLHIPVARLRKEL